MPKSPLSPSIIIKPVLAILLLWGAGFWLTSDQAHAESSTPKTLVELYTSQGCSSCPPANALLKKYIDRKDVIALTLPVDYWDYLGWKDTHGKRQFSNRQRSFAASRGDGQVYTPQVVANGVNHAVGSRSSAVDGAIGKSHLNLSARQIPLQIKRIGNRLTISSNPKNTAHPTPKSKTKTTIWLALTSKKVSVPVPKGENRGKIITYYNVVLDLQSVGTWTGDPITIDMPKSHTKNGKSDGCVVFLQQGPAGPIIAAAEL